MTDLQFIQLPSVKRQILQDPLVVTQELLPKVTQGFARKYYRFRPAKFYGGIASADCLGCNLKCVFCWSQQRDEVDSPSKHHRYFSPQVVVKKLHHLCQKHKYRRMRITGNEPTLYRTHLLEVLRLLATKKYPYRFILETNGILLANREDVGALDPFRHFLHVRVCIKGATSQEFERVTLTHRKGWEMQLRALDNLIAAQISTNAAFMLGFSPAESIRRLQAKLAQIDPQLSEYLELEQMILYPHVRVRLLNLGIRILDRVSTSESTSSTDKQS